MKTINLYVLIVLIMMLSCQQDPLPEQVTKNQSNNYTTSDTEKSSNTSKKGNHPLGFIHNKCLWLKNESAVVVASSLDKAILFNPKVYSTAIINNSLYVWSSSFYEESGCDCGANEVCVNGVCQSTQPCGGNCPQGSSCVNGICVSNNPCNGGCPVGQVCINNICTSNDPCGSCPPGQTCINGTCQPNDPCESCAPGEVCINGQCMPDPCAECDSDELCINGECQSIGDDDDIGQIQTN